MKLQHPCRTTGESRPAWAAVFPLVALALQSVVCVEALNAALITDGILLANIGSDGTFDGISLNGVPFETTNAAGIQFQINNGTGYGFINPSLVTVTGSMATYAAQTHNGIDVSVTSRILGPLASNPTTTGVLEQLFVFTNNNLDQLPLAVLSGNDPDLNVTDDIVAFDAATRSVFARDMADAGELMAVIGETRIPNAVFGFDVGFFFPDYVFPLEGNTGPVGPGDIAMTLGFDFGTLASGQSVDVSFRYLFGTNLSSVPNDFRFDTTAVPEPSSIALLGLGVLVALGRGRRRRNETRRVIDSH